MESAAEERRDAARARAVSSAEAALDSQRQSIQNSRERVLRDIESATNPRYRETLEAALKHLDEKLAALR